MNLFKKAVLGTAVGAMALATAAPADARTYYRHYRHDNTGAVVGAGILGLAIGAIAASSGRNGYYNGGYYDGYYNRPGYAYYYDSYPGYYTYNNGYYYNGYRYDNGWFYDGRGHRMYDRNSWDRRWGHDRYDRRGHYRR